MKSENKLFLCLAGCGLSDFFSLIQDVIRLRFRLIFSRHEHFLAGWRYLLSECSRKEKLKKISTRFFFIRFDKKRWEFKKNSEGLLNKAWDFQIRENVKFCKKFQVFLNFPQTSFIFPLLVKSLRNFKLQTFSAQHFSPTFFDDFNKTFSKFFLRLFKLACGPATAKQETIYVITWVFLILTSQEYFLQWKWKKEENSEIFFSFKTSSGNIEKNDLLKIFSNQIAVRRESIFK